MGVLTDWFDDQIRQMQDDARRAGVPTFNPIGKQAARLAVLECLRDEAARLEQFEAGMRSGFVITNYPPEEAEG